MLVKTNICDHRKCRRKSVAAYDIRAFRNPGSEIRHYEVCAKHDEEFFKGGGWIDNVRSERIAQELVPS